MKHILVVTTVGLLCWIVVLTIIKFSMDKISNGLEEVSQEMKVHVGEKVLIDEDSLTVVDYKPFSNVYVLSNGIEVSREIVEK